MISFLAREGRTHDSDRPAREASVKLQLTWSGGTAAFDQGQNPTVGRVPDASVTIPDAQVSRAHLSFVFVNDLWTFEDTSSNGTFIGGQRVTVGGIAGPISMHLGGPTGPVLNVAPVADQAPVAPLAPPVVTPPPAPVPPAPAPAAPPPPHVAAPAPVPPQPVRPAVAAGPVADMSRQTVRLDDRQLRLELDGKMHVFTPGTRVVVGRDPSADVHSDSQLVSGHHCAFSHDGASWWVEDLQSSRGTWIDGRKITRKRIEGAFFVLLGDDDAGEPLRVITAGEHRKPRDRTALLVAGTALAVALIGGLLAFAFWPDTSEGDAIIAQVQAQLEEQRMTSAELAASQADAQRQLSEALANGGGDNSGSELRAARLATALISVPDEDGNIIGTGSGALVSDDGLILTNIHVVLPGLEFERTGDSTFANSVDPERVIVAFPSEDGGPADRTYIAEQVAAHPAHDAALIRVVEALDGNMDELPEPLPLGDSTLLRAGDEIAVVGYPGTAFTQRVSIALSNFQSFQPCVNDGNPVDVGWGCLRDYDEGYLNLAGETLEGGSSGGPILRNGTIVGIQLGTFGDPGAASAQNLGVPIDLIKDDLF